MIRATCLALVLAVATAAAPSSPPSASLPDTPAGRAFGAWLVAFNSGDRAMLEKFLETSEPDRLAHLDDILEFREQSGGFDVKRVEESTPLKIVVLLEDRLNEKFAKFTLQVRDAEPSVIKGGVPGEVVPPPAEFAQPHLSESLLTTALRGKLQTEVAADRFSGAVLVAADGKPVFEQAYGLADRARAIPNTVTTRFRIGSMNKMFTAVSVLQLVQAGKISLDDPLGKYLPDYPNKDVATQVTIRELLTHTGGTGDIFGPEFDAHRLELRTLDDYVKLYGARGIAFKPGSKWDYSNYGFVLLGVVVEKVSGESYYDYVREHVYVPAGMTSTGSEPESDAVSDRSIGYTKDPGAPWKPNTDTLPYRGTSAGGGYSTVGDLASFASALEAHRLLNATYTEMLTTGTVDTPGGKYAFGFDDQVMNGTRCFGHGGGAPGMNGDLEICPGPGYVVAVLANMDPQAAARISDFVTNRLSKP
jgi:CubicO group peptidase (beta-lactamase class C family)